MSYTPTGMHQPGVVHTLRWNEILPWLILFRAARAALLARVIALNLAGVILTQWGWLAFEEALLDDAAPRLERLVAYDHDRTAFHAWGDLAIHSSQFDADHAVVNLQPSSLSPWIGPLVHGWVWAVQPAARLDIEYGWRSMICMVCSCVWAILVWSIFGGASARIASLYLTRTEKIGPLAAIRSAAKNWKSAGLAVGISVAVLLACLIPLALAGLLMRLGVFALLASLLWPVSLLLGAAGFVMLIGVALGWPLMWTSVATEQTDSFDAISRAFAYVFQRPLHFVVYVVLASGIGVPCYFALTLATYGILETTEYAVSVGLDESSATKLFASTSAVDGSDPSASIMVRGSRACIRLWETLLSGVANAFPMAYLWPAMTAVYLLLRRHVDSTEMDEIALDNETTGDSLPPLTVDPETGVPQVEQPPHSKATDGTTEADAQNTDPPTDSDDQPP